jgi:hypothetical protein
MVLDLVSLSEQAASCRILAEQSANPTARRYFEHLAQSYEALAESSRQLEQANKAKELLEKLYRPISK